MSPGQPSATREQPISASETAALLVAVLFPSLMSWLEFRVLPAEAGDHNPALQAAFALGKVAQFAFPLIYVNWGVWRGRRFVWPGSFQRAGLSVGILFGLIVAAGTLGLYFVWLKSTPVFEAVGGRVYGWLGQFNLASPAGYFIMAAFIAVPHSFLEEYYWRWFIFGGLQRRMPMSWALAISALAFMAHHVIVLSVYLEGYFWEAAVPFSLCVAGGGVAWAWLYQRTGSLLGPWLSHLIVDLALMMVGFDLLRQFW